jgi:hypothetical protein
MKKMFVPAALAFLVGACSTKPNPVTSTKDHPLLNSAEQSSVSFNQKFAAGDFAGACSIAGPQAIRNSELPCPEFLAYASKYIAPFEPVMTQSVCETNGKRCEVKFDLRHARQTAQESFSWEQQASQLKLTGFGISFKPELNP